MARKLKAGTKKYERACIAFAMDQLDILVENCGKSKKWVGPYINIMDCLTDVINETDVMLETIEDYEAECKEEDAD